MVNLNKNDVILISAKLAFKTTNCKIVYAFETLKLGGG